MSGIAVAVHTLGFIGFVNLIISMKIWSRAMDSSDHKGSKYWERLDMWQASSFVCIVVWWVIIVCYGMVATFQ